VRVTREATEEALELFVQQGVAADALVEVFQFGRGGQVAVDQQVGNLEEARVLGQLVNGVPAVAQDAGIAVNLGDGRRGGRGVHETGVKRDGTGLLQQLRNVVAVIAFGRFEPREVEFAAIVMQGSTGLLSH
jgi:hypothetical protein